MSKEMEENGNMPLSDNSKDLVPMKQYNTISSKEGSDTDNLVETKHRVSLNVAVKLRIAAIATSFLSIFVTLALGVATLVIGFQENSSASFGFALTALLDVMSSAVVLWRYYGGAEKALYSPKREFIACIVLGVLFIVSSFTITTKSVISLANISVPSKNPSVYQLALINGILCSILAIVKFILGIKLESKALTTDAFNSLAGALSAFAIFVTSVTYEENSRVWYLDSVIGIFIAVFLLIYGTRLLWEQEKINNYSTYCGTNCACCKHK
ncbi:unnamed protein product [Owenia fusiformis]|uniref:Cation efflux protein transmembrane domain-containing protein n=1 Tax=Owenia fusiformis TaxID=6347 RepID=A0A8J1UGY2_OWEFU|nr:unnamed protein product [Owenia fusiformis]